MNKKLLLANGLLLIFSTALALLLLEQAYRFYLFGSASFSIEKLNSVHEIGVSGLITPSERPEIIYELKPGLNTYFKLARFETNSNGLRDRDYKYAKDRNTFRIAVIGDSFTMPAGVAIEESYHSLLEERLNNEKSDSTYQLINFGVGGYNLRQYLAVIKHKARKYNPDLIIVGFCPANDHNIPNDKIFEQQYRVKPATQPFFQSFVIKGFKRGLQAANKRNKIIRNTAIFSDEQKQYMSLIFSEMSAYSSQIKAPIIITYLTTGYDAAYAGDLKQLVTDNGLEFANASQPFNGINIDEFRIYPIDSHPNATANRIFADELYTYLNGRQEMNRDSSVRNRE